MANDGTIVENTCTKPADKRSLIGPYSICRSMKEGDLRNILDECVRRGVTPMELASLADFEKLSPQLKKVVKLMNAEFNGTKEKVKLSGQVDGADKNVR